MMGIDKQIILIACTGAIALYSLIVLICGPVRTRGFKNYQSYLKNTTLYKEQKIEEIWKRDKRKLSNLKGFETSAFIIDLLFSLGCCALLILFQIGRLDKNMENIICFAGFGFVLIAFIFQFAYIWLLGSVFYRHFYDAKYKYDYYNNETNKEFNITISDIYNKANKTSKLMATSLPFAILFLLIIAATGFYYYKYFDDIRFSPEPKNYKKDNNNQNQNNNNDINNNNNDINNNTAPKIDEKPNYDNDDEIERNDI